MLFKGEHHQRLAHKRFLIILFLCIGKSTSKPVQKVTPDLRGRLKTAAGLQLISKSRRQETLESMKYTVDNKEKSDKTKVSKSQEKKVEPIKDLKMTVKNEPISQKKAAAPKSKAPAIAPARVAQEGTFSFQSLTNFSFWRKTAQYWLTA